MQNESMAAGKPGAQNRPENRGKPVFFRTKFTWGGYFFIAYFAYYQASLGPLIPFIRDELNINYTISGMHMSAFALGMVIAGIAGSFLGKKLSRKLLWFSGSMGMAVSAIVLSIGLHPAITITGALGMGIFGSLCFFVVQAVLSDLHGSFRAVALTEANILASIAAGLVPMGIGVFAAIGLGWRGVLYVPVIFLIPALLVLFPKTVSEPHEDDESEGKKEKLPIMYWVYWIVIILGVSAEWCMAFWGAEYLQGQGGIEKAVASTVMSLFFLAMVMGRFVASRLTRRVPAQDMLIFAVVVALIGFPFFWIHADPIIRIAGLFVTGFGVANFFPLALAAAMDVTPKASDRASAFITSGAGGAIFAAPLILGSIADFLGIFWAYGIVAVFLSAMLVSVVIASIILKYTQKKEA